MNRIYALVDCNNFYVSCERVFNPKLIGKPVVVLSNNDGIIVARSNEVKTLGIPMAAPLFKVAALVQQHNIHVFSANYQLYGDLSQRVMQTLMQFSPNIEIYSIDEAFLCLENLVCDDLTTYARTMRETVMRWTGIPVSIGVAPTKTLAKIAGRVAKRLPETGGVCNLCDRPQTEVDAMLKATPVGEIWGVGRRNSVKLNLHGISTALDFRNAPQSWMRKHYTVCSLRTQLELQGTPCLALREVTPPRKSIISSRSFGQAVTTKNALAEAVASYTARAAEKLREQESVASILMVYVTTNYFNQDPQYHNAASTTVSPASAYTPHLISAAINLLDRIYRDGYRYKKAGVVFGGISQDNSAQGHFFDHDTSRNTAVMHACDRINRRWGHGALRTVAEGIARKWRGKQEQRSPRYTTSWAELLAVK